MSEISPASDSNDHVRNERPIWAYVAGAILFVGVLAFIFPIAYGANDDSGVLLSLAMGGGKPADALLTTLAPSFAITLIQLYQAAPAFPWYGALLGLGTAVGVGLLLHAAKLHRLSPLIRTLTAVAVSVMIFDAIYFWTFTKAMLLLQLGAFAQFLRWQLEPPTKSFPYFWVCFGLIAGYCFRWYFFHYTLAFGFPIALFLNRRSLLPLVVVASLFGAFRAFDASVHAQLRTDPDFVEYDQFHSVRYKFHDLPEGFPNSHTPKALSKVGWTEDDFLLFRSLWGIYDEKLFHADSIIQFLDENQKGKEITETIRDPLESPWLQVILKSALDNAGFLVLAVLPWFLMTRILLTRGSLNPMRTSMVSAGMLLLFAYLFVNRLPMRVGEPVMLYMTVVWSLLAGLFSAAGRSSISPAHTLGRGGRILIALQLAGCLVYAERFHSWTQFYYLTNRDFRAFHAMLPEAVRSTVVIPLDPTVGFTPEANHPLWAEKDFDRGMIVLPVGTKVNSAIYKRFLDRHGFASGNDLLKQAIQKGRVYFYSYRDKPATLPLWLSYINRRIRTESDAEFRLEPVAQLQEMSLLELVQDGNSPSRRNN